jgi:23S rRNA pseudouridine2605 synthase
VPVRRSGEVSLERALSKLGLASRAEARELIRAGRVSVDGRVVRNAGLAVVPERVRITIDGAARRRARPLVVLLHKPRGFVVTRSDPQGRPTVGSLVAEAPERVVPVGRLDLASTGLLLLTSDTRLGDWLADPRNAVPRRYAVTVRGELTDAGAAALREGVRERGELLRATAVTVRKRSRRETHLLLELTEGRNREVRRLLSRLGHEVTRLARVGFGGLELGELRPGRWRVVGAAELRRAFPGAPVRE